MTRRVKHQRGTALDSAKDAEDCPALGDGVGGSTFAALAVPAFRRYFMGQAVSMPGTWMQTIAQGWLVLQLSDSGTVLGTVTAAQFVPVLLLAPYGGLLADRVRKRTLLLVTQSMMCVVAIVLGALTLSHHVSIAWVVTLAVVLGLATALDNPTRQSLVSELVPDRLIRNAVTLNSVMINSARAVGPGIAGILISVVGPGWCFMINAISFAAVLAAVVSLPREHHPTRATAGAARQILDGLHHVMRHTELLWPLASILVIGTLAWEFPITLPLLARTTLHGGPRLYGWLTSAMGAGAVSGGLVVARFGRTGLRPVAGAAAFFGLGIAALSAAGSAAVAIAAAVFVGWGGTTFMSTANATMQLAAGVEYRGRVMALWSVSFAGSTPIGGPVLGAVGEHASPRIALAVGTAACWIAAAALLVAGGGRRIARPGEPRTRAVR